MAINKRVTLFIISTAMVFLTFFVIASFYKIKIRGLLKNNIILAAFFDQKNNESAAKKDIISQYPFLPGEKLKYNVYSAGLKVGYATITYLGNKEIDGILTSCVTVEAKLPGFYDLEKIFGNIENYSPIRVERKVRLFGSNIYIIEEYNQNNNEVLITRKSKETKIIKIESKEKISNIILLLYHFRYKKSYKIGDSLKFNLPTKRLEMIVDKETEINVPMGKFKAIFVKSLPSQFKVWFRNGTDSIPLRIQGAIGFGNMYLELSDIANQK